MLLVRINRTTVATALFHLGLAEHLLPSYKPLDVPSDLTALCGKVDLLKDPAALEDNRIVLPLVRKYMSVLYGFAEDADVDVTVKVAWDGARLSAPSTPVRRPTSGAPPSHLPINNDSSGAGKPGSSSIGVSLTSAANSRSNLIEGDDALYPGLPLTRSLSFDSTFRSGVDINKLAGKAHT